MPFKRILLKCCLTCLGIILAHSLHGQLVEYSHPHYEIGFTSTPHWSQELHDDNGKVFEVIHPNNNMRISLSYIYDCRNPQKHLKRMSGLKGLITPKRPYDTVVNDKKALIMKGTCLQGNVPYRKLLVAVPEGRGLYLMEICCPEDCYLNHQDRLQAILGSLRVGA